MSDASKKYFILCFIITGCMYVKLFVYHHFTLINIKSKIENSTRLDMLLGQAPNRIFGWGVELWVTGVHVNPIFHGLITLI